MTYNVLIMTITNIFLYTVPKYFIKNKKLIIKYYYSQIYWSQMI